MLAVHSQPLSQLTMPANPVIRAFITAIVAELASPALGRDSPPPSVLHGWNTSIGNTKDRSAAAEHFGFHVSDDDSLWYSNSLTPFIGKTLHMTGIDIIKRNAFNTIIETSVKTGIVLWTINPGAAGLVGPWTEHINGAYTGVSNVAGWESRSRWIENDNKHFLAFDIANDWGWVDIVSESETTLVMNYSSYKKSKFVMTWTLEDDASNQAGTMV